MPHPHVPAGWRATAAATTAGLAVWVTATLLRALAGRSFGPDHLVAGYLAYAADWTFIPCIGIGVPSAAIALWLSSRGSARRAVIGGFAVGAIGFGAFAIAVGAGTAAVSGIAPTLLILAAELWLAFKLRARWSTPRSA